MPDFRATYRLQLGPGLAFADARELVPYLRDLGISHLYLSPAFQARPDSAHGYDVTDPTRFSPQLGGEEGFRALAAAASEAGLGIVLDIVPNHMATDDANPYWSDPERRARFFDIDPATGRHRRFFDIDDLAGVRQEDPEVFAETHRLALALVGEGLVDGLRIDHPDGLADPAGYLERLRAEGVAHVWVEKILESGEALRDWPVEGTVGYEFLNDVAAVCVEPAGEFALTRLWIALTGEGRPFAEVAHEARREQTRTTFAPDVERLRSAGELPDLEERLAAFPVYRTYVRDGLPDPEDVEVLDECGQLDLVDMPRDFITRFQQTTPPVMAKGVEDTAFYRDARLLALNDVGGDPGRFGISVARFHAGNAERARRFPRGLLVTQTHDTKRSGDVRARIGALSARAAAWEVHVRHWFEVNRPLRLEPGPPRRAPDDLEEYFIYQTLIGAWPIELERTEAYLEKALREAKRNTSWVAQDRDYEAGVMHFVRGLYAHEPFLSDFEPFAHEVAVAGDRAGLAQLLLKLCSPGVPDVYQGDELLDLSLVDPDNRRPVDWGLRRATLAALRDGAAPDRDSRKLWLIWRALDLRARRPGPFAGAYAPVDAGERVCAFLRGNAEVLVAAAVREDWSAATLAAPGGRWRDVLRGGERDLVGTVALADLLDGSGLALFERVH